MDLKGSLVDTNLRIFPSEKLITFLKNENLSGSIPVNIGKLIKGRDFKSKENLEKVNTTDIYLKDEDVKILNKIKSIVGEDNIKTTESDPKVTSEDKSDVDINSTNEVNDSQFSDTESAHEDESKEKEEIESTYLTTSDMNWLYVYLKEKRSKTDKDVPYLHTLLEGSDVNVPDNIVIKRNPVLEARCVKLRAQQEAREYRKMTKSVDNVRMKFPEDSIAYQMKQLNRQLIAILQFIISIFAGFLFGFRGVEWMVGNLDFGFRLLLGVMCALIIALAEIYFLAKKLNEELSVPETTQLGGPPKFADSKLNDNMNISKSIDKPKTTDKPDTPNKPHQD